MASNVRLGGTHRIHSARYMPFHNHEYFTVGIEEISRYSRNCSTNSSTSPPGQNGHQFADDIFGYIFMNEKFCIFIRISLKFLPYGPIDNNAALLRVMPRRRTSVKALPELMLLSSLTHICDIRGDKLKVVAALCCMLHRLSVSSTIHRIALKHT